MSAGVSATVSPRFPDNHSRVEYAWAGSHRNVTCHSSGQPTPKIDWLINNIVLQNNGTYNVIDLGATSHLQVCCPIFPVLLPFYMVLCSPAVAEKEPIVRRFPE